MTDGVTSTIPMVFHLHVTPRQVQTCIDSIPLTQKVRIHDWQRRRYHPKAFPRHTSFSW